MYLRFLYTAVVNQFPAQYFYPPIAKELEFVFQFLSVLNGDGYKCCHVIDLSSYVSLFFVYSGRKLIYRTVLLSTCGNAFGVRF